jgi:predicted Rossmann fold nucleotide-binding protein DprA/Smf involved in DNA uptake
MTDQAEKERLKALREARKTTIDGVKKWVKENREVRKKLTEVLGRGPKSIPEIALETGIPSHHVLWHLTSMRKYGKVAEGEQSGDYFLYVLLKE